jgi:hypothetical protein
MRLHGYPLGVVAGDNRLTGAKDPGLQSVGHVVPCVFHRVYPCRRSRFNTSTTSKQMQSRMKSRGTLRRQKVARGMEVTLDVREPRGEELEPPVDVFCACEGGRGD